MTRLRHAALAAALLAAGTGAAVAGPDSQAEPRATGQARLAEAYPALRAAKQGHDELPAATRGEFELGPEAAYRPNARGARLLLAKTGKRMFLVPGPNHGCAAIVADDASTRQIACGNIDAIERAPLVGAGPVGDGYVVQGIAPAGTSKYEVRTVQGESVPITLTNGAFLHQINDIPATLSYTDASGADRAIALFVPQPPTP